MKCERYFLPYGGTGHVDTYILDSEISYQVERKWPAMVICPGGGYLLSATKEGEGAAMPFLSQGFHCFVVRYSTYLTDREGLVNGTPQFNEKAHYPTQILELMYVLHLIHEHAEEWNVDENRIFAMGFSAGGHVVGTLATRWNDESLIRCLNFTPDIEELKLTGAILSYPMLDGSIFDYAEETKGEPGNVSYQMNMIKKCLFGTSAPTEGQIQSVNLFRYLSPKTCPLFIWHTGEDVVTRPVTSTDFIARMQELKIPCEYHLFQKGPHGLAASNRHYAKNNEEIDNEIALWIPLALNWLRGFEKNNL